MQNSTEESCERRRENSRRGETPAAESYDLPLRENAVGASSIMLAAAELPRPPARGVVWRWHTRRRRR